MKKRPRIIDGNATDIVEGQWVDLFLENFNKPQTQTITETREITETITEIVKVDDEEYDQLLNDYNNLADDYDELKSKVSTLETENRMLRNEVEDLKNLISSKIQK